MLVFLNQSLLKKFYENNNCENNYIVGKIFQKIFLYKDLYLIFLEKNFKKTSIEYVLKKENT